MTLTQPEWVESLKEPTAYNNCPERINILETATSYLFITDDWLYKIKKTGNEYPTLAVKEAFCREECNLSQRFNPNWSVEVLPVTEHNGVIKFGGTAGTTIEYALKMETLPDQFQLTKLLYNNKIKANDMVNIATKIAEIHAMSPAKDKEAETGKPELFRAQCIDLLFQLKRYFEASLTQPILDMIRHPLEKFLDENKRLFAKRLQKGRIVLGHGAFLPEHIFLNGNVVRFISPQEIHKKLAILDVANDISSLTIELTRLGKIDLLNSFINHYIEVSKDKDLLKLLPIYQTYCALKQGVKTCEIKVAQKDENLGTLAMEYFNLAVSFSRKIPRQ